MSVELIGVARTWESTSARWISMAQRLKLDCRCGAACPQRTESPDALRSYRRCRRSQTQSIYATTHSLLVLVGNATLPTHPSDELRCYSPFGKAGDQILEANTVSFVKPLIGLRDAIRVLTSGGTILVTALVGAKYVAPCQRCSSRKQSKLSRCVQSQEKASAKE